MWSRAKLKLRWLVNCYNHFKVFSVTVVHTSQWFTAPKCQQALSAVRVVRIDLRSEKSVYSRKCFYLENNVFRKVTATYDYWTWHRKQRHFIANCCQDSFRCYCWLDGKIVNLLLCVTRVSHGSLEKNNNLGWMLRQNILTHLMQNCRFLRNNTVKKIMQLNFHIWRQFFFYL